jgi:hypothetical protein
MNVTKAVVVDLWPLYTANEASADTRALVDEFLLDHPDVAEQLRRDPVIPASVPPLPGDLQTRALTLTRRKLRGWRGLLLLALIFTGQAFGRIVSDTSWDVSPRNFIAVASVAAIFWIAWLVSLWRMRASILVVRGRSERTR